MQRTKQRTATGRLAMAIVVLAASLVVSSVVSTLAPGAARPAGAAGTTIPLGFPQAMAVDPGTGRVFVVGGDAVAVFAPNGTVVDTIDGIEGGYGIAEAAGSIWVPQTESQTIARIDPVSLAKVAEIPVAATVDGSVASVGGKVYFVRHTASTYTLVRLDPGTLVQTPLGSVPHQASSQLSRLSESPARLLVANTVYDVSGAVPTAVVGNFPYRRPIAGTEDGRLLFGTTSGRVEEQRVDGDRAKATGVVYPAEPFVQGVAYRAASGTIAIAGGYDRAGHLFIARRGEPAPTHTFTLGDEPSLGMVRWSADGSRVYVVTTGTEDNFHLETFSLAPKVAAATPTTLRPGLTASRITGTGLGSITSASLGGQPVVVAHDGPDALEIEVPVLPAAGPRVLQLTGPWGGVEVPLTVAAAQRSAVSGRVTALGDPVAGATVRLEGPELPATTQTTGADGRYTFASVPAGPGYDLTVTKGAEQAARRGRTLPGPGPWTIDVDLLAATGSSPEILRTELPPGPVRRLVVDPATGRVYVAVGDEVAVYSPTGRRLARIPSMPTASDLQIVGTKLHVLLRDAGEIVTVDLASSSLPVTSRVAVDSLTMGSFAVVGTRAVVTEGDLESWPATQSLAAVDLVTGATQRLTTESGVTEPREVPVAGAPNRFLAWGHRGASQAVVQWDATTATPTAVSALGFEVLRSSDVDLIGEASADRAWTSDGRELALSTMTLTGRRYEADRSSVGDPATYNQVPAVARSTGHGGVLAFGAGIALQGTAKATHRLDAPPASRSLGLSPDGDTAYAATPSGHLVVTDLRPLVTDLQPQTVEGGDVLTLRGSGLGGTTSVAIDGASASWSPRTADDLAVTLPDLADGVHRLTVTTPWGTSPPVGFRVGPISPAPFATWSALVTRVTTDLTAKAPTTAFRTTWVADLASGKKSPGDLVAALRQGSDNTANVDPVARLYRAFLGRQPDAGGVRFWINRKRAGTWSVTKMADSFASSTEFKRKYGTLSNRQFVTRIYTDVLGRTADGTGVDFWTGRLDRKVSTRGQVMVGFSESSEYRRKQAENTDVAMVYVFLLGRTPTASEAAGWVERQKAGTSLAVLAAELLASPEYVTHITG